MIEMPPPPLPPLPPLYTRYSPAEAARLTGHSANLQRQWRHTYGDFRALDGGGEGNGGSSYWTWAGVQRLAIFGEVLADLKDSTVAIDLAFGNKSIDDFFGMDLREYSEGDLLLYYWFGANDWIDPSANRRDIIQGATTAAGFALVFNLRPGVRPTRTYLYNFSAMQRRLYAKLTGSAE